MKRAPVRNKEEDGGIVLQLYVSGMSERSMAAIENIQRICGELPGHAYRLEIIDIYKNPKAAAESHIVFSPSLIKCHPLPRKVLIGTLADTHKVIEALGINFKTS